MKDDVIPPVVPAENATEAEPLLNARPDPLFVATTDVGAEGGAAIANHPVETYCSKTLVSVLQYKSPTEGDAGLDSVPPL